MQSKSLRAAARRRTPVKTRSDFYARVQFERDRLTKLSLDPAVKEHLTALYKRGEEEARRGLDEGLTHEVDVLAEELLTAEEEVNVLLHELGVGLVRGRSRSPGPALAPAPVVEAGGRTAFFRFEGEFWTDELDDLIVVAEDRCIE